MILKRFSAAGLLFLFMILFAFSTVFLTACGDEDEWWEDKSKILWVFYDERSTPQTYEFYASELKSIEDLVFEYNQEDYWLSETEYKLFEPDCKLYVDGIERGHLIKGSRQIYDIEREGFDSRSLIYDKGEYNLRYAFYKDDSTIGSTNLATSRTVKIIIK